MSEHIEAMARAIYASEYDLDHYPFVPGQDGGWYEIAARAALLALAASIREHGLSMAADAAMSASEWKHISLAAALEAIATEGQADG
jgi:hypothetical protein